MLRKITIALAGAALAIGTAACGASSKAGDDQNAALRVGVNPVPHGDILKYVKDNLAAKAGLKLDIVTFNDYVLPNLALKDGKLQANYFQTVPFMQEFTKAKGVKLSFLVPVHLEPLGVYSKKVKNLQSVPQGATVALANDPANNGRGLKLLADNGLITLKPGATLGITERDVVANPKGLKFKALEAAQIPRSRDDVDLAVINGNYALLAKLNPATDALALEKAEGNPYANGLVTLTKKKDDPRVKKLAQLLQSPEVKKFIQEKYTNGAVLPSF